MNIIIAEPNYSLGAVKKYQKLGNVSFWFELSEKERAAILPKAEILVVRLALNVTKKIIDQMPKLKIIATSTTGLNHIDAVYAGKRGIKIVSLRGHTDFLKKIPSTAEETIGLMLALARKLPWAFEDVRKGNWRTNNWAGCELFNKTIGLLGLGRLGKIVTRYARAFRMRVIACDPNVSKDIMKKMGVEKVSMEEVFKKSDFVSLHVLLTDDTHNLVKEKHLKMMRSGAYLINTARGELIEKGALEKALKNKWIAGAAIDVMWNERSDGSHLKNNALVKYAKQNQNLLIVPHIGGTTFEAMAVTQDFIAELVKKHFDKSR